MWVESTPNGKFKFSERYTDYLTGKTKKICVTLDKNTAQSRKLAQQTLQEKVRKALNQTPASQVTLSDLIDQYRKYQEKKVKPSTYTRNYWQCETFKKLFGPDSLVDKFTAGYVNSVFLDSGKEPGCLNEHIARFKALFRWGYRNDFVKNIEFLDKIEPFADTPYKFKIQDKYLEKEELRSLVENCEANEWRLLIKFMALSGLRTGEAVALHKHDVDITNRVIHVSRNYDAVNRVFTSPKTSCSVRDVYIQDELLDCVKEINSYYLYKRFTTADRSCPLFMFGSGGAPLNYYSFRKYLGNKSLELIGRTITPHALRHTHASLLLSQGVSIDTISRRLGHENSKVTRQIYLHVTKELQEKDNAQISCTKII